MALLDLPCPHRAWVLSCCGGGGSHAHPVAPEASLRAGDGGGQGGSSWWSVEVGSIHYLLLAVLGLHCCAWAFSSCGEWGCSLLMWEGFSLRWLLLLRSRGPRHAGVSSVVQAHYLQLVAQLHSSTWNPPGPGMEPMSPALAGRFLSTLPQGRSDSVSIAWESVLLCSMKQKE